MRTPRVYVQARPPPVPTWLLLDTSFPLCTFGWAGTTYFFLKMAIKSLPMQLQNGCVSPIALISGIACKAKGNWILVMHHKGPAAPLLSRYSGWLFLKLCFVCSLYGSYEDSEFQSYGITHVFLFKTYHLPTVLFINNNLWKMGKINSKTFLCFNPWPW